MCNELVTDAGQSNAEKQKHPNPSGISHWRKITGEGEEAEHLGNLHCSGIIPRGCIAGGWNMIYTVDISQRGK